MKVWKVELNDLLEKIERHTSASLWRIKREFERSGLTFDRKFRKRFLRLTNNRLSETYDRIEIESLAMDQRSRGQHRYYDDNERNGRQSVSRFSEDREVYPKRSIFWTECKERSLYSDRPKHVQPHRLGSIHKRLGKKIIPNDDDDDDDNENHPMRDIQHETVARNPFRSGRSMRSVATYMAPESTASQSNDEKEAHSTIRVKFEVPSSSPKTHVHKIIKRARERDSDSESGNDFESGEEVIEVPSKKQKINSESIDLDVETNAFSLDDMTFYCVHCMDSNEINDSMSGSIEDVYGHWLSGHTDLKCVKPFWFYVTGTVACLNCDAHGTYHELIKHHREKHSDGVFAIVRQLDRLKCALCRYDGEQMIEHFATEHDGLLQSQLFNPARLPVGLLSDLFDIDIHKKRQCTHCNMIFETQHEAEHHHLNTHDEQMNLKQFCDNKSAYVICDYCSSKVDGTKFFNHIELHQYDFSCSKCEYQTKQLIDLVLHEKDEHRKNALNYHCFEFAERLKKQFFNSKVVFGNGLVLTNHNFKSTIYDDSKQFDVFIDGLVEKMRRNYNRWMEKRLENSSSRAQSILSNESDAMNRHRGQSVDSHRNPFRVSSLNELEHDTKLTELEKQNQLDNNLSIVGLPRLVDDDVLEMFLKFCIKIKANITAADINDIYRNGGVNEPVIVKFRKYDAKVMVKNCSHLRQVWTNDLVKLPADELPTKIFVNLHTTRYYGKMVSIAREARKSKSLFSYYLCKRGLAVRRTEHSKECVVLSTSELIDYIYGDKKNNQSTKENNERTDRTFQN